MRTVVFVIHLVGMNDEYYSSHILISKPNMSVIYYFNEEDLEMQNIQFMVHSKEKEHENMPHVHVMKDHESVRYSLETLERIDHCSRDYLRDEKKKTLPALDKYLPRLKEYWMAAMGGYRPPEFDFQNKQYYPES